MNEKISALRYARVRHNPKVDPPLEEFLAVIARYLPENYQAEIVETGGGPVVEIVGEDVAGWTLVGYVIPRLASGLYWAEEVTPGE
jgi:hypothetical protein